MNKTQIIRAIAGQLNVPQATVKRIVNEFFRELETRLGQGEKVTITGFGRFTAKASPPRMRRNPKTGAKVQISQTVSIRFNTSRKARNSLIKIFEHRSKK